MLSPRGDCMLQCPRFVANHLDRLLLWDCALCSECERTCTLSITSIFGIRMGCRVECVFSHHMCCLVSQRVPSTSILSPFRERVPTVPNSRNGVTDLVFRTPIQQCNRILCLNCGMNCRSLIKLVLSGHNHSSAWKSVRYCIVG